MPRRDFLSILHAGRLRLFVVLALGWLAAAMGCGSGYKNLARVSGKVTLGGQPLADAVIMFSPTAAGAPSTAKTDAAGAYTLVYTRRVNGAEIGEHSVTISTHRDADSDADPPTAEVPEKVPYKYRIPGELKATVKKGANTLDFALEPGPLEEPKPEKAKGKKK